MTQQSVPSWSQLVAYAKTIHGQTLRTIAGRSEFRVEVDADIVVITPVSTQKPRRTVSNVSEVVLARFAETGSWNTSDYSHITRNSSYLLALIRAFSNRSNTSSL